MRLVSKFLRLSAMDRRLLVESVFLLGAIKLGLWVLPFRILRQLMAKIIGPTTDLKAPDLSSMEQVAWAMGVVSRKLPIFKNCLNRALATQLLFGLRRQIVDLRIGVTRSQQGKLEAHAWIESTGQIVIGEIDNHSVYIALPPLEGKGL